MTARARPDPAVRAILDGDRRALARLITAVENREESSSKALRTLYARSGRAQVVGVTGPLGVGKSSLINSLIGHLRTLGRTVGVVAVDPSSPFTGGSVLGDRIRFERAAGDKGVFVRSMANRGHAGGVAAATREVVRLLDAFGMDVVLVETVGSGQADVEIRDIASTSIVVVVPHLGDEVQTLKAGLFEIADIFCVNKSDLPGADAAAKDLAELVALGTDRDGWRPVVVRTSAERNEGIEPLWTAVAAHEKFLDETGARRVGERRRASREIVSRVRERVGDELEQGFENDRALAGLLDQVVERRIDPHSASERLYAARQARR